MRWHCRRMNGGWMKIPGEYEHHIRLYNFPTGELVTLLKGHDNVVNGLAFSHTLSIVG